MDPNAYKKNRLGGLQCYDNNGAAQFAFDLDAFIAAIERLAP